MDKPTPHYKLHEIKEQMTDPENMFLTGVARKGIFALGITEDDAVDIVQALTRHNFNKAMTTHHDNTIWQDLYNPTHDGVKLYVKFQQDDNGFFTISFKQSHKE